MNLIWKLVKTIRKFIIYKILRLETRGVRVVLIKKDKVLLIKHPYDNFWVLPGGGVHRKENIVSAAIREIEEEVLYKINPPLEKLGTYKNYTAGKKDIVSVYVARKFEKIFKQQKILDKIEIQKIHWFNFSNLPKTSAATKCRLTEVLNKDFSLSIRPW